MRGHGRKCVIDARVATAVCSPANEDKLDYSTDFIITNLWNFILK